MRQDYQRTASGKYAIVPSRRGNEYLLVEVLQRASNGDVLRMKQNTLASGSIEHCQGIIDKFERSSDLELISAFEVWEGRKERTMPIIAMSYNITNIKVSKLSLRLPLRFDFQRWINGQPGLDKNGYEKTGRRWCIEDDTAISVNLAEETWELSLMGGDKTIKGIIEGDAFVATELESWGGDGSGHLYSDVLLPLFEAFKGTLEAIAVWEEGDTIKRLNIRDGIVEETKIA
jgi:hypothetical protein